MSGLRHFLAAAALIGVMHGAASAQTMRFETSVGSFDMELNPTNDPNLQPLVDNIVAYIGLGRYHYTAINRAVEGGPGTADDFVLQMGGFLGFPPTPADFLGLVRPIDTLNSITTDADNNGQVDFNALSNTRGTVSLALSNFPNSETTNPNSGTSSFFINLSDENAFLDDRGFVPFARVNDLTTVERIMQLQQTDLNGSPGSSFDDTPLLENGRLVILKSVRVLQAAPNFSFTGPIAAALAQEAADDELAAAAALAEEAQASMAALEDFGTELVEDTGAASIVPVAAPSAASVPEPAAATLVALAMLAAAGRRRRR